jgi:transposase
MESLARPKVYPDELRQRAVRLVKEWRDARTVTDGGYTAACKQLGLHRETLRRWVLEAEGQDPYRPGQALLPQDDQSRLAALERENRELRRANEILKSAAVFFGAELDRRQKKSSPS